MIFDFYVCAGTVAVLACVYWFMLGRRGDE